MMNEIIRLIGVGLVAFVWGIFITYLFKRIKVELFAKRIRSYKKQNILPDYAAKQLSELSDEGYKLQTSESVFAVNCYRENNAVENIYKAALNQQDDE